MLRQTFNVPLPEDIPDQKSQFHSVSLKPVAKAAVYRAQEESAVAKAAFCFDYTALCMPRYRR